MSRLVRVGVAVAVIAAMGTASLVCTRVAQRGRHVTEGSTFGAGPKGAKALYLLAEAMGAEPMRWVEDISRLPDRGLLVVLGGCARGRAPSPLERHELTRWVEQGGVLLVAGARQVATPEAGLGAHLEGGCPHASWIDALWSGPGDPATPPTDSDVQVPEAPLHFARPVAAPVRGIGLVALEAPARIAVDPGDGPRVLLRGTPDEPAQVMEAASSDDGLPMAVVVPRGRGTVVLVASASPFHNRSLGWAAGGLLFARLYEEYAPGAPVLFDEYHLGVGQRRSLARYVRQIGGGPLVLQFLFVIALVLWSRGARVGAPRVDPPPPPLGTSSYVDAIARLFQRSEDAVGALRILIKRGLSRVARHHHVRTADLDGLANGLDARARSREARAVRALGALEQTLETERSLPSVVRALDDHIHRATSPEGEVPHE